jgi:hypothetical protein
MAELRGLRNSWLKKSATIRLSLSKCVGGMRSLYSSTSAELRSSFLTPLNAKLY